jgi:Domain of unknown function (DUF6457)
MDAWIDELAEALGEDPLTEEETDRLLRSSREVAHRVERKTTPLAAFLLGFAAGRRMAGGRSRDQALSTVLETLESLLPPPPTDAPEA